MAPLYPRFALFLMLSFGIAIYSVSAGGPPAEPGEENLVNEDVNLQNGLYTREYSLRGDGTIDYRTARQITRSEYNDSGESVVEATAHPLFYWFDEKMTGVFSMWIDQEGDGCVCHIVPYIAMPRTARVE
jgi:hypothetical protein